MKNIILLAVQGAGKGSLAQRLTEKYGYTNISMGEVMRNARNDGTERAKTIAEYQDKGILVPFEITMELMKERIAMPDCEKGYILDGFPRDLAQAEAYDKILSELQKDIGIVINLEIPTELVYQRITGRRTCKNCGKIYNIYNEKFLPKQEGICDVCGGPLYQRSDDTEDAIKTRVETYFKVTSPLIEYYKNKGILYTVSSMDIDETVSEVEKILQELGE